MGVDEGRQRWLSGLTRPVQKKIDSTVRRANLSILDGASQVQLRMTYRQMLADGRLPPLTEVGFKVFSQTDEDGILLFLFSVLGSGSKTCIEICAGNGIECNTANLLVNHGWSGLLVDGDDGNVDEGRGFYAAHPGTYVYPPQFLARWITRGNVNEVVAEAGFAADVDLLSLDLDGVDYWIWEALDVISPRVVVLEYQDILGPEATVTVPYADDFNAWAYPVSGSSPNFSGASLGAFVKLGRRKGYRLIGTNRFGYNAFFLRDDVGTDEFPELSARDCFGHRKNAEGIRDRYPTVKALPWVEV